MRRPPPVHVVPDRPEHGVARYAAEVAEATAATVVDPDGVRRLAATTPLHLHVTDRLFGTTSHEATGRVVALCRSRRVTLTLHDLPQPEEGPTFRPRAAAYRAMGRAATGVAVSSHHERRLAERHLGLDDCAVVHLPVHAAPRATRTRPPDDPTLVVGLLGWVYPGKGHRQVIAACAGLDRPVVVRALGRASPGHAGLVDSLRGSAEQVGVALDVTGWIEDGDLPAAVGDVDVPVAAHRRVSASGSMNSWIAMGRRPRVVDGAYARELDALRPGTLQVVAPDGLAEAIATAAARPTSTWLPASTSLRPSMHDVARAYLDWWG